MVVSWEDMDHGDDNRPTKVCPECAESVLVAARRCRFCGYRFDEPGGMAATTWGDSLLAILRRPRRRSSVPGYLAQAGIMLDDDEQPAGMWLGRVDGNDAYIIVTTARLFVTDVRLRQKRPSLIVGHLLSDLQHVEVERRLLKSVVVIEWHHAASMVVTKLSSNDVEALCAVLRSGGQETS
jgi:hypothetical protein